MSRIDELLQQRAAIDAELKIEQGKAEQELEQAKSRLEAIKMALKLTHTSTGEVKFKEKTFDPIDETDAGMGIPEPRETAADAQSFTNELAELRARSQARRRR